MVQKGSLFLQSTIKSLIPFIRYSYITRNLTTLKPFFIVEPTPLNIFSSYLCGLWREKITAEFPSWKIYSYFRDKLIKFNQSISNSTFNLFNPTRLILLSHLRLDLSYLNAGRFKHNSQLCSNQLCSCDLKLNLQFVAIICSRVLT